MSISSFDLKRGRSLICNQTKKLPLDRSSGKEVEYFKERSRLPCDANISQNFVIALCITSCKVFFIKFLKSKYTV